MDSFLSGLVFKKGEERRGDVAVVEIICKCYVDRIILTILNSPSSYAYHQSYIVQTGL